MGIPSSYTAFAKFSTLFRHVCPYQSAHSLRKDANSNLLIFLLQEKKSDKKSDISHTSAYNINCEYSLEPPRRGSSNKYPQSMFLA